LRRAWRTIFLARGCALAPLRSRDVAPLGFFLLYPRLGGLKLIPILRRSLLFPNGVGSPSPFIISRTASSPLVYEDFIWFYIAPTFSPYLTPRGEPYSGYLPHGTPPRSIPRRVCIQNRGLLPAPIPDPRHLGPLPYKAISGFLFERSDMSPLLVIVSSCSSSLAFPFFPFF